MVPRLSSDQRRLQLVRAALAQLAELPVEQLTTRRLAGAVGLTQPAIFRHFASKEALLEALVAYLRRSLEELVAALPGALSPCGEPRPGRKVLAERLEALFAFAERHPGALRLLFHDAAGAPGEDAPSEPARIGEPLRDLVRLEQAFVAGLVAGAVERTELPDDLDADRAAELFAATFQGALLAWHLGPRPAPPLAPRAADLAGHFWAGLAAGVPARADRAVDPGAALTVFDARPVLAAGRDPFDEIHAAHAGLAPGGVLAVVAPFRPLPLVGLFEGRGKRVDVVELAPERFLVVIRDAGELHDLADLPAPEPLEELLLAASALAPGEHLVARMPRFPRLLLPRLDQRGFPWHAAELPAAAGEASDGALLVVERPDAPTP